MPLDPSIILQAGNYKQPDIATTLGQIGQIRAQHDASELQRVQLSSLVRKDATDTATLARQRRVGAMAASGDLTGADNTALSAGDWDMHAHIKGLQDEQRAALDRKLTAAGPVAFAASQQPYEQRKATIAAASQKLIANGWKPEEIASFDPTDANIGGLIDSVQSLSDALKQHNDDRSAKLAADEFLHKKEEDAANRGLKLREIGLSAARLGEDGRHNRATEFNSNAPTPSKVIGPILAKVAAGQRLSGAEAKAFQMYQQTDPIKRQMGELMDGVPPTLAAPPSAAPAPQRTPATQYQIGQTATGPKGQKIRWTGNAWVAAK